MAINADFRLKVRHFIKKHQKLLVILVIIVLLLAIINKLFITFKNNKVPNSTYTPNVSVLDGSSEVPKKVANAFEEFIDSYIGYCNNRNYVAAYNMVSEDCKKNFFGNDYDSYVKYDRQKFNTTKRYAIQNYSNFEDKYIYSVKIFDDYLATGLTGQSYKYQEEKMTISYDKDKNLVVSVGNYIESKKLQYMASNDYLRAEITDALVKYSFIVYNLKLTNRTNYTIVIKDGHADAEEVGLAIGGEIRTSLDDDVIVLLPGQTAEYAISFDKFYDSETQPDGIVLDAVRVMENYTRNPISEDIVKSEIENAVDKFSMTIVF